MSESILAYDVLQQLMPQVKNPKVKVANVGLIKKISEQPKKDWKVSCDDASDAAIKAIVDYYHKEDPDRKIDIDQVNCGTKNNPHQIEITGTVKKKNKEDIPVFISVEPPFAYYYENGRGALNQQLVAPFVVKENVTPTIGNLFQEPETKQGKEVKDKLTIQLNVLSAINGKVGKDGMCRANRSRTMKKDCVAVKARSYTALKYAFSLPTMPKNLMHKGAAIRVRLSDCKTMTSQLKCKSAKLM